MQRYRRVAVRDRYQIHAFIETKLSVSEIAKRLGFHRSTIHRELKRNSGKSYSPESAQRLAKLRYMSCRRKTRLTPVLIEKIKDKVELGWAPEQVAGRFRSESFARISHETIYRFIRYNKENPAFKKLRQIHKRKNKQWRKRKRPSWRLSIHDRPESINRRDRIGDWERDGMFVKDKRQILVCTDRRSRYTKIIKVKEPYSVHITLQTELLLQSTRKLLSITNDNGNEFLDGQYFKIPVYYCDPKKPYQRGTVENTIGLLRQYLPKHTDLQTISDEDLQKIEDELNHRPRKCLDYKTPYEVFFNKHVALAM